MGPCGARLEHALLPAERVAGQSIWSTNWVDYSGTRRTDPLNLNRHCFDPTKTVVLNPEAWANPGVGRFSFSPLNYGDMRGVRWPTENLNLGRTFRLAERVTFNIRGEFQNVFNRMRIPQPSVGLFTSVPQSSGGIFTGGFGTILTQNGTTNVRTGLIVGRITF